MSIKLSSITSNVNGQGSLIRDAQKKSVKKNATEILKITISCMTYQLQPMKYRSKTSEIITK